MEAKKKKVLLGASWSIVEPLGLFFLSQIARDEGWEPRIVLTREPDFSEMELALREFKPDLLGFTAYSGNHLDVERLFCRAKTLLPNLLTVVGGPQATYFPLESRNYADFTVISEGLNGFRRILRGEAEPGIVHLRRLELFPQTDREQFYRDHSEHRNGAIKNIITSTGCPYSCSYCYNSSKLSSIASALTETQAEEMKLALNAKRLFPFSFRSVSDVVKEADAIRKIAPATRMIFFQDDIFGSNIEWLREFARVWNRRLAFHAQMRFEFADPANPISRERVELMREAGCTGLTFAIEAANPVIRSEVLNRHMDNEVMFRTMAFVGGLGYRVRTEQILGLPRGATSEETKINLEADLEVLELNVQLREQTGLPTIAWASTLAPYRGTAIERYCIKHGFYRQHSRDIPREGYRFKSLLDFPSRWVGPGLSADSDAWLARDEQEEYKDKLYRLMTLFSIFALMPKGHRLAEAFLQGSDQGFPGLNNATRSHLYNYSLFEVRE